MIWGVLSLAWKRQRVLIPILCGACKQNIDIGQVIINHHVSYFPEIVIPVHGSCHTHIHTMKSKYPHLRPDPRQTMRWYRKKGLRYISDISPERFSDFIDNLRYSILTDEQKAELKRKYDFWVVKKWWETCDITMEKERGVITKL